MRTTSFLLTRDQVAESYGVSKRYLETAPARGEGPRIVRIGRLVRYRIVDVEAWIERCVEPEPKRGRN